MSQRNVVPQAAPAIPADILALFGNPPLLSTEDPKVYNDWLGMVAQVIKPKGIIEWMWVRDIADLSWEIRRLRGFKALLIEQKRGEHVSQIQRSWGHVRLPGSDLTTWSLDEYERQLKKRKRPKLNTEEDSALAFLDAITNYERIDRLLASAELRRNTLLREIQHYREGLAHLLQDASDKIIGAEYEEAAVAAE